MSECRACQWLARQMKNKHKPLEVEALVKVQIDHRTQYHFDTGVNIRTKSRKT